MDIELGDEFESLDIKVLGKPIKMIKSWKIVSFAHKKWSLLAPLVQKALLQLL